MVKYDSVHCFEKFKKILAGRKMLTKRTERTLLFSLGICLTVPIVNPNKINANRIINCEIVAPTRYASVSVWLYRLLLHVDVYDYKSNF